MHFSSPSNHVIAAVSVAGAIIVRTDSGTYCLGDIVTLQYAATTDTIAAAVETVTKHGGMVAATPCQPWLVVAVLRNAAVTVHRRMVIATGGFQNWPHDTVPEDDAGNIQRLVAADCAKKEQTGFVRTTVRSYASMPGKKLYRNRYNENIELTSACPGIGAGWVEVVFRAHVVDSPEHCAPQVRYTLAAVTGEIELTLVLGELLLTAGQRWLEIDLPA